MSAEWEETTLADVSAEVSYGYTESASDKKVGPRFLRITDIQNGVVNWSNVPYCPISKADHGKYRLQSGDIVVARTGNSTGENFLYQGIEDAVFASYLIRFRINPEEADPAFIWYNLRSKRWWNFINSSKTGSAQPGANAKVLGLFPVSLPPLTEQKSIAQILASLDDKIELNRRMNETLEALAQSLFKSWFVDATQSALPKGWRYATIAELCEINLWTLGKGDELDQIEYVEISEVMRGNIANIQTYERGEEPSRARRRLRHGDTVLSTVRPDRGAYFLCLNPSPNLIGSTGFAALTPTKAPWSFIHAAMTQTDVFEYLGQQADGGAYPAVRPEIIGALEVPWPNKSEMVEDFHRTCAPLYEHAELNRQESRILAALRDALLPKLLSGELRVPDAKLVKSTDVAVCL